MAIKGIYLYIANFLNNTVEIYNICNPIVPKRVRQFNAGNLNGPVGIAITGNTFYVSNFKDNRIEIYNISNPKVPVRVGQFHAGNLKSPAGLVIFTVKK